VDLYRVFSWDGASTGRQSGGPLFVARDRQGAGRHDAPARYGAWYCARDAVAAVAESIQFFRGSVLTAADFQRPTGIDKALARLWLDDEALIVDLDDARELVARKVRPSNVATRRRPVTQRLALAMFEEGVAGFQWWSTLEAEWANVTLFHERVVRRVRLVAPPQSLTMALPEVREAAAYLGIRI
jgi:hypothetical protein